VRQVTLHIATPCCLLGVSEALTTHPCRFVVLAADGWKNNASTIKAMKDNGLLPVCYFW
jgi:hypothetical protein